MGEQTTETTPMTQNASSPRSLLERETLIETLAALAHDQWSGWMRYLFSRTESQADMGRYIPREWVERWERQANTPYDRLSEAEKDSDRKEAQRVLAALGGSTPGAPAAGSPADLRAAVADVLNNRSCSCYGHGGPCPRCTLAYSELDAALASQAGAQAHEDYDAVERACRGCMGPCGRCHEVKATCPYDEQQCEAPGCRDQKSARFDPVCVEAGAQAADGKEQEQ